MGLHATAQALQRKPGSIASKAHKLRIQRSWGEKLEFHECLLSQEQLAYLAGFIDGDGTVTLAKQNPKKNRKPVVRLCNTSRIFLHWCQTHLDLPSTYLDWTKRGTGFSDPSGNGMFIYNISGISHAPFYRALQPYLVIKRAQMEILLEWIDLRLASTKHDLTSPRQADLELMIRFMNLRPSQISDHEKYEIYESSTWEPALERMKQMGS